MSLNFILSYSMSYTILSMCFCFSCHHLKISLTGFFHMSFEVFLLFFSHCERNGLWVIIHYNYIYNTKNRNRLPSVIVFARLTPPVLFCYTRNMEKHLGKQKGLVTAGTLLLYYVHRLNNKEVIIL